MTDKQTPDVRRRVFIEDHTGNKRREARVDATATVDRLIPALITALELPATDPSGRPITYHLAFEQRQLALDETLGDAGVIDGSTLQLVPQMTAGGLLEAR